MELDLALLNDPLVLAATARQSGLANAQVRRVVWPLLLRVHPVALARLEGAELAAPVHGFEAQVDKDVERSMYLVPQGPTRAKLRRELRHIIDRVLRAGAAQGLSYFQGFHDVVTTVLLVCRSSQLTECVVQRMAHSHLRPMLEPDLTQVIALLDCLYPLLALEDGGAVHGFLVASGVQPYFALPWVLTWFSHSVANFDTVCRLFDLFLASDPSMPLFVSAALVLWARPHLARVDCEYSAVHSFFSKLFADISMRLNVADDAGPVMQLAQLVDADLELIIARALQLHARHSARFIERAASPFAARPFLQRFPLVLLDSVPRSANKPLLALQYRFEGVRKQHVRQRRRRVAALVTVVAVAVAVVAWMWSTMVATNRMT